MSRTTILFASMMILALGMFAISGCGDNSDNDESASGNSGSEAQAAAPVAAGKGSPAPDFTLKKVGGGELQLSSLRGKAVIVDFWDTWCPPCRKAMPHLQELSETYSGDLVVVGVALGREGEAKVKAFAKERGLTFDMVLFNNDQKLIADFGGIESIPTTFLIDGDGIIRETWVGAYGLAEYERAVKAVLGS
ncbi:MAG: TlpA family protein disulfide reductase [Candidatus Krumholzibacteria bacterium]|nr:TlpA family protein disulfide reductase [Candidatus Krumholzibacteria bacterium]